MRIRAYCYYCYCYYYSIRAPSWTAGFGSPTPSTFLTPSTISPVDICYNIIGRFKETGLEKDQAMQSYIFHATTRESI